MATDLEDKQGNNTTAANPDPGDAFVNREFGNMTSPANYSQDGVSPRDLKDQEEDAGEDGEGSEDASDSDNSESLKNAENASLFNSSGGDNESRFGKAKRKLSKLSQNKWLVGGVIGGSSGVIIMLLLGVLLIGSLKIPNLAEHIAAYQFARVSRNYSTRVGAITAQDTRLSTASKSTVQAAFAKYGNVRDKTWGSMWNRINNYRPEKIVANMKQTGSLDYRYERSGATGLWQKKLTAVVIDGKVIPYENQTLWKKYFSPIDSRNSRIQFSRDFNQALAKSMQGRSVIVRGAVAKSIRADLGIKLKWWNQAKYAGKTQAQAEVIQQQESHEKLKQGRAPVGSIVDDVKEAAAAGDEATEKCLADPKCAAKSAANGGAIPESDAAIAKTLSGGVLNKVSSVLGAATALIPVCMIYDGSLSGANAAEQIDQNNAVNQRAYYAVASAADQQKVGATNGEAVGAMNWKIGDISQTPPEQRAAGGTPNTLQSDLPQASVTGDFSVIDAVFTGPFAPLGVFTDKIAGDVCPVISDVKFGLATGALSIVTGGTSAVISKAANEAASVALKRYLDGFVKELISKKSAKRFVKEGAAVVGGTLLAQYLVQSKMSSTNTALAVGPQFVEAADSGGNLNANETNRRMYGRPLTNAEVAGSRMEDRAYEKAQLADASMYDRYINVSNPHSLATKVAMSTSSTFKMTSFTKFINSMGNLFRPTESMTKFFGSLNPAVTYAADHENKQDYGIIQWGWSAEEERLIDTDVSYSPMDNQANYTESTYCVVYSSKRGCLEKGYYADLLPKIVNKCFGLDESGKSDPGASMGNIITAELIKRELNGDVVRSEAKFDNMDMRTQKVAPDDTVYTIDVSTIKFKDDYCNPSSLGTANSAQIQFFNQPLGDIIFRYRLEKSYQQTLDHLTSVQEAEVRT